MTEVPRKSAFALKATEVVSHGCELHQQWVCGLLSAQAIVSYHF